jgi:Uma2 family endonuclease
MAMPKPTPPDYWTLAAEALDGRWELWDGDPREKPGMSWEHGDAGAELARLIGNQIDRSRFRVRVDGPRLLWRGRSAFLPDVAVVPLAAGADQRGRPDFLERYAVAVPLVVEVWSASTGDYDLAVKLAAYRARGDLEIWRLHPDDRTLTRWIRQDGGSYAELVHPGGVVELAALPGVRIDLDALFAG